MADPPLFLHHESSLEHDPSLQVPGHPDVPARLTAIERALQAVPLRRHEAPAATREELELVHTAEHIERVQRLAAEGGGRVDRDTYIGPGSYTAAVHAAGGACELARLLTGHGGSGFCATRPSGHHAESDRAMGFCLFNNVAVAAALAVAELGAHRVMIIDWDVHHGNGTANIFRHRRDVLYASIHQAGLFPGTGETSDLGSGEGRGYTINVPVPAGTDDEVWRSVLEHVIVPVGAEYRPDLVLISAGYDAHRADPLGGCRLESESFGQMTRLVQEIGAPIGAVLEGGYDPPALAESVVATLDALSGNREADSIAPDPLVTARAAAHVGHYWTL